MRCSMRIVDIIEKKMNNISLSEDEIFFLINGYVKDDVPDYQMSAFMMAVCLNSMSDKETSFLTNAMAQSGDIVDLSDIDGFAMDKHSTGGVADTTTLIAAPIVAACGVSVCKMSGRGLGHTGGTLDKLESIPNFKTEQTLSSFKDIIKKCGLSIIGQSYDLAPADKKMYALRDVTATVNSIPLIASSIMSKKIASGCDGLVLDVKLGSGSFVGSYENAKSLAQTMVSIGKNSGIITRAVLSDMNQPLGNAVGNSLEVIEAIEVLKGSANSNRLKTVAILLAKNMLEIAGIDTKANIDNLILDAIDSGKALNVFKSMVKAQGGVTDSIDDISQLPHSKYTYPLKSTKSGYINKMDTRKLGIAASILGAGRNTKDDVIDNSVGYVMQCSLGNMISTGDIICLIHYNDETKLENASALILEALEIEKIPEKTPELIYDIII